jgi:psp operon transcriptional activator
LSEYYGRKMAAELGWEGWPGFGEVATRALENHIWPGNVRELRNVVERAVYRWADPAQPVDYIQFDPFDSPWRGGVAASAPAQVQADSQHQHVVAEAQYTTDPSQAVDVTDFREATEKFENLCWSKLWQSVVTTSGRPLRRLISAMTNCATR